MDEKIVIYKTKNEPQMDVRLEQETVWLTQSQIAFLFGTQRPAITKHLSNIFKSGELSQKAVRSILEHTASDCYEYIEGMTNNKSLPCRQAGTNSQITTILNK